MHVAPWPDHAFTEANAYRGMYRPGNQLQLKQQHAFDLQFSSTNGLFFTFSVYMDVSFIETCSSNSVFPSFCCFGFKGILCQNKLLFPYCFIEESTACPHELLQATALHKLFHYSSCEVHFFVIFEHRQPLLVAKYKKVFAVYMLHHTWQSLLTLTHFKDSISVLHCSDNFIYSKIHYYIPKGVSQLMTTTLV